MYQIYKACFKKHSILSYKVSGFSFWRLKIATQEPASTVHEVYILYHRAVYDVLSLMVFDNNVTCATHYPMSHKVHEIMQPFADKTAKTNSSTRPYLFYYAILLTNVEIICNCGVVVKPSFQTLLSYHLKRSCMHLLIY
jgi:hypothetical protein